MDSRLLTFAGCLLSMVFAAEARAQPPKEKNAPAINDPKAFQGYTLISPLQANQTTLIDMQGRVVRTWDAQCHPALTAYLLENGNLLRPGKVKPEEQFFGGAGEGGRIQEYNWKGELVWDFKFHDDKRLQHHDVCKMPNGNVLMLVWNKKTYKESIEAGRSRATVSGTWLYDSVVEVKPTGKTTGQVVWEWHVWDHLIQDHDKTKANFGDVAAHPELIDINFGQNLIFGISLFGNPDKKDEGKKDDAKKDDLAKLKGIGYVGGGKSRGGIIPDWPHFNAVAYNPELDQIMISSRSMSEVYIIDHGTTTAEAASHRGGKYGKGGDLLFRIGNPRAYKAGTTKDQSFFTQHNAHWIPRGLPGEGRLLFYNNGGGRPGGNYSSVDEIPLPADKEGVYSQNPVSVLPVWTYTSPRKTDFYSWLISSAQRLPNGNTLICQGMNGIVFEVTPAKEVVWKYSYQQKSAPAPFTGPTKPGQILSSGLQDFLKLSEDQKKQTAQLQKEVEDKINALFQDDQRQQLKEMQEGKGAMGGMAHHGQLFTAFHQTRLKLTAEQKNQTEDLQKIIQDRLEKTLTAEQRKQLKSAKAANRPFNLGLLGFGDMFGNSLFRAYRYGPEYPGLIGRDLTPEKQTIP